MSFIGGLTTAQKVAMIVAGAVLIVCAFVLIIAPELWSGIGLPLPSYLGANTVFRWIVGLVVLVLGCFLFSALFAPRKRSPT